MPRLRGCRAASTAYLSGCLGGRPAWNVLCCPPHQDEKLARHRLCLALLRGCLGGAWIHHCVPDGRELRPVEPRGSSALGSSSYSIATRSSVAREQEGQRAGDQLRRSGPPVGREH